MMSIALLAHKSLKPMPQELVERLFAEFKEDRTRWEAFASRERSFLTEGTEALPGRAQIVDEFVREKLGEDHPYWIADLILKIRDDLYESSLTATQRVLYRMRRAFPRPRWMTRLTLALRTILTVILVLVASPLILLMIARFWWKSRSRKR